MTVSLFVCSYGWSRARYVYSLISGVGIFFIGAGVTGYHGIHGLIYPQVIENLPVVRESKIFSLPVTFILFLLFLERLCQC